jgi:hypothetical protein
MTDQPAEPLPHLGFPAMDEQGAFNEMRAWERLLDAGLIANRNPPAAPEVRAITDANDALFRDRARRRRMRDGRHDPR